MDIWRKTFWAAETAGAKALRLRGEPGMLSKKSASVCLEQTELGEEASKYSRRCGGYS